MNPVGLCRALDAALGIAAAPGDEVFGDDLDDVNEAEWLEVIERLDELAGLLEGMGGMDVSESIRSAGMTGAGRDATAIG